jgi:hypothetical protein
MMSSDEVQSELEKAQRDVRGYSTEVLKLRAVHKDSNDKVELPLCIRAS